MNLPPDQQQIVMDILAALLPDREVRVFGSRVKGTSKPYADLDLVIMGDEPVDGKTLRTLKEAFDESNLPYQVDVVEWARTGESFRSVILACSDPLPPAKEEVGQAYESTK
jgi:type I restriction enzyme S subunit